MKFYGPIGYAAESQESLTSPGVWEDVIVEIPCYGDITRDSRRLARDENIASDLSVNNVISIVTEEDLVNHFHSIKYVKWRGIRWVVDLVEVKPPRLILNLGGVYNGPIPTP